MGSPTPLTPAGRYREELDAMESDPYGLQFQWMLQCETHAERLQAFSTIVKTERKRLSARATLQSLFRKDEEPLE